MRLDEFGLIGRITKGLKQGPDVVLGPGDDAAVLRPAGDLAVSTDLLVEGVHFRRDWSSAFDVGRKIVAVNVADIESMGAAPSAIVIGLAVPAELDQQWVHEFAAGARAECERAGVSLVGGDLSRAAQIVGCATAHGNLAGREAVTRAGARPGDVVAVRGQLGLASAGLALLQLGYPEAPRALAAQRCPQVPYGQGLIAARAGASAMCDISDGLVADLGHIAAASQVGIELSTQRLPIDPEIELVAAAAEVSPLQFVLGGGEDHALAATFGDAAAVPAGWRVLGRVVEGTGVSVDSAPWQGSAGWNHFGSATARSGG